MRLVLLLSLLSTAAVAQTIPLGIPMFNDPPELNGAAINIRPSGLVHNLDKKCTQMVRGTGWSCFAQVEDVQAANAAQDAAIADTYMSKATAQGVINSMQSSIGNNANGISGLESRVTTLEGRANTLTTNVTTAQTAATSAASAAAAAQTSANAAGTAAAAAQSTANAAQTASASNASAITALITRVTAVEAAVAALQALPRRACTTFTVPTGLTVPLTGISTVINVPLTGVPVAGVCDTGAPSRMPLGARPDPVVTTAGTVNMAFVSNAGLLSSVIAIPSGTYRLCCDV